MEAPDQSDHVAPEFRSFLHQSTILVADDEVMSRNRITLLLQVGGYWVLSASDGKEALELSRKYPGKIDLVITDSVLHRLNGMRLCDHLLQERPGIKVILMTHADTNKIIRQNTNLAFLPKPFDGKALLEKVSAVLDAPDQAQK